MSDNEALRDDPDIADDEDLYRCVHPAHYNVSEHRPSSATFKGNPRNRHPSVDRSSLSTPEESLARKPGHIGVARLSAGTVRAHTTGVASDPLPDNPAHAIVIRDPQFSEGDWRRVARKLAKACTWAIRPSRTG